MQIWFPMLFAAVGRTMNWTVRMRSIGADLTYYVVKDTDLPETASQAVLQRFKDHRDAGIFQAYLNE